jgi:hypothetical protein
MDYACSYNHGKQGIRTEFLGKTFLKFLLEDETGRVKLRLIIGVLVWVLEMKGGKCLRNLPYGGFSD